MNFEEFKVLVEDTKKRHPVWFGLPPDSPATEEQIQAAEGEIHAAFPEQYRQFLKEYGGGYFGFTVVYSLQYDSDWNIISINEHNKIIRGDYILVSENGVGDFYGFRVEKRKCEEALYFFDHETQEWSETALINLFQYIEQKGLSS